MALALRLAARGMTTTDPNPRVGCVIASGKEIIASGWHKKSGEAHAEIEALANATGRAVGTTVYVTLEPCSHQGRTGACAKALSEAGVSRVVCAIEDENPQVSGGGIAYLEAQGVAVESGLLREQAETLNAGFFKRMRENRPWVRVKTALSLDGGTALQNGVSQWISSEHSRTDVQKWRARSSAVMTGIGTLISDNPSLNVRHTDNPRQPLRVVVDSHWRTPATAKTLELPGDVLIAGCEASDIPADLQATKAELLPLPSLGGRVALGALMQALSAREINELQVEAGPKLAGALLEAQLVDEILLYQAPVLLGSAAREPFSIGPFEDMSQRMRLELIETVQVGPDLRLRARPRYTED